MAKVSLIFVLLITVVCRIEANARVKRDDDTINSTSPSPASNSGEAVNNEINPPDNQMDEEVVAAPVEKTETNLRSSIEEEGEGTAPNTEEEIDDEDFYDPTANTFAVTDTEEDSVDAVKDQFDDAVDIMWTASETAPVEEMTTQEIDFITEYTEDGAPNCDGMRCKRSTKTDGVLKRKAYRLLTDDEREHFHKCVQKLHNTTINGTKYTALQLLAKIHHKSFAPEAHQGCSFLCFHREYLRRFEKALGCPLPCYDSVLDNRIGKRYIDSSIFGPTMVGNSQGEVKTGPFKGFPIYDTCIKESGFSVLWREAQPSYGGALMSDVNMKHYFKEGWEMYGDLCTPYNTELERDHGFVHVAIGGMMKVLNCASCDPLFFMHHCFVDYLFEKFRTKSQHTDIETDYLPDKWCPKHTKANDPMKPFSNMINRDGLNKSYTEHVYKYEQMPHEFQCTGHSDCNSTHLWCDLPKKMCMAKVQEHTDCYKYKDRLILNGCFCQNGNPYCDDQKKCKCSTKKPVLDNKSITYFEEGTPQNRRNKPNNGNDWNDENQRRRNSGRRENQNTRNRDRENQNTRNRDNWQNEQNVGRWRGQGRWSGQDNEWDEQMGRRSGNPNNEPNEQQGWRRRRMDDDESRQQRWNRRRRGRQGRRRHRNRGRGRERW